jgi:RNA polymerase sigma-70 factor (ECF subfamily)
MMNICLRYTGDDDSAMEVLNTGFFKVFRSIDRFNNAQGTLYTWIRTIVVNSCLDHIRSRQKQIPTGQMNDWEERSVEPEVFERMKEGDLLRLIRYLPPATQAVFNLYAVEGYTHKEIGGLLGISEGTSKWHYSEAKKQLRGLIEAQLKNS